MRKRTKTQTTQIAEVRDVLSPDSMAWRLTEVNMTPAAVGGLSLDPATLAMQWRNFRPEHLTGGLRRYQVLVIQLANGNFKRYVRDLGSAYIFPPESQVDIWALGETRVGELLDMAELHRRDGYKWGRDLMGEEKSKQTTSLIDRLKDQKEEQQRYIRNQSVIGAGVVKQRNDFSQSGLLEFQRKKVEAVS